MNKFLLISCIVMLSCSNEITPQLEVHRFDIVNTTRSGVTLKWEYNVPEPSYFVLLRDSSQVALINNPVINTFTDKGLEPLTEYQYELKVVSRSGNVQSKLIARTLGY
ncbi:MAG: fibronectin type III domain-containing protein [Bacteroidota bacterium]